MSKVYSVRFFLGDGEHQVAKLESNKYIPIPSVGSIVYLESVDGEEFIVKSIEYGYPASTEEEYDYDVCIIMEASR